MARFADFTVSKTQSDATSARLRRAQGFTCKGSEGAMLGGCVLRQRCQVPSISSSAHKSRSVGSSEALKIMQA